MKFKSNIFLTLVALTVLIIQGCKCDDPNDSNCPNYDPCLQVTADFANFKMEERIMEYDLGAYVETQNTVENNVIYFSILDESVDSVHWFIGTDPRERAGTNIDVYFKYPFGEIEITCIAYNSSVASCLGEEATIDTLVKVLNVREWWDVPYLGQFEGTSNLAPGVSFTSEIDTMTYYSGFGQIGGRSPITFLTNFPNGHQMPLPIDGVNVLDQPITYFSYNGFITSGAGKIGTMVALYNYNTANLTVDYEFLVNSKYELFTYKGQRK